MKLATRRQEALSVSRIINDILIEQLGIPHQQIVNDTTFEVTGNLRPDLLISGVPLNDNRTNDEEYLADLLLYVEAKDSNCKFDDAAWRSAVKDGAQKSKLLKIGYFGVTNTITTVFYNASTLEELKVDGTVVTEFQDLDVLRALKSQLEDQPELSNIILGQDTQDSVSEAKFNKKLWELREIYRSISFQNNEQKINFTIAVIALAYFEEKAFEDGTRRPDRKYWSDIGKHLDDPFSMQVVLENYLNWLISDEVAFVDFEALLKKFQGLVSGADPLVGPEEFKEIYLVMNSIGSLHGTGFDLFGAVYEAFASSKEKRDFGEYFTRRHYSHEFARLLLQDRGSFNSDQKFSLIDPFCGTGGMLTESFKYLRGAFLESGTYSSEAQSFLENDCFYGVDVQPDNMFRTRLNMFLVGDGHTHIYAGNTLRPNGKLKKEVLRDGMYDFVLTNPPYGPGTIEADTDSFSSHRMEIAALFQCISLLKIGGRAGIILPDGVLENPQFVQLRRELLQSCEIIAVISLPKFAFAPYTKEKTYALIFEKKRLRPVEHKRGLAQGEKTDGSYQRKPIWMYIIDNDGFANSDKRFPTRLKNGDNRWMHDELSRWVDFEGKEQPSVLEHRWSTRYDDSSNPHQWTNEKGESVKARKGGFVTLDSISSDPFLTLLPETYLRREVVHTTDSKTALTELRQLLEDTKELTDDY